MVTYLWYTHNSKCKAIFQYTHFENEVPVFMLYFYFPFIEVLFFSKTAFGFGVIRNNVLKLGCCLFFSQMSVKQSDVIQITLQQLERNVHNEKKRKKTENFLNLHLISKVFVCFAKFFFPFLRTTASWDRNDLIFS